MCVVVAEIPQKCIGEGEFTVFSSKRRDVSGREDLIEPTTPRHDARLIGLFPRSSPVRPNVVAAKSGDKTLSNELEISLIPLNTGTVNCYGPTLIGDNGSISSDSSLAGERLLCKALLTLQRLR